MTKKLNIYLASGWFSPYQDFTETQLFDTLSAIEEVDVYSPRRDGTKLEPGALHNHEVRKKVFQDNVDNILHADLVVANLDPYQGFVDTGTFWEVAYANQKGIPVVIYTGTKNTDFPDKGSYKKTLDQVIHNLQYGSQAIVEDLKSLKSKVLDIAKNGVSAVTKFKRVLVVGPAGNEEVINKVCETVNYSLEATTIMDSETIRNGVPSANFNAAIRDYIKTCDLVITIIDDRDPIVSYAMGVAYGERTPIVSYTDFDYGVNLMLLLSIVNHCQGVEKLEETLKKIDEFGVKYYENQEFSDIKAI
ncbi:hypothetical protein CEW46_21490 [Bacillus cereus]|nr:hypothetical protein CEW46_21490 [Bacillus cereus]